MSATDEAGLVSRAKNGDQAAIGQLYRRYAAAIYGYVASRVGDPAAADDLTSDVFLRALEGLPRFEYRGISISAWLYRIAHDRVVDYMRRGARRPTVPLEDQPLPAPESIELQVDARLRNEQLRESIEQLTPDQSQVILLRFSGCLKLKEIAYVMDKSVAAVKMLQLRALARLRQLTGPAS